MIAWWRDLGHSPERGGGRTALTWVLVIPTIMLIIYIGVQVAIYFYARGLALHAAHAGVLTGRTEPVSPARAQQRAEQFLRDAAGDWLTATSVTASGGNTVRVTVTGQSLVIIPGLTLTVSQTSAGVAERPAP